MKTDNRQSDYEEFKIAAGILFMEICSALRIPQIVDWLAKMLSKTEKL